MRRHRPLRTVRASPDADERPVPSHMSPTSKSRERRRDKRAAMPLLDHLREIRRRLAWSTAAVVVGAVAAWVVYPELFALLRAPLTQALRRAGRADVVLAMAGVAEPFTLQLQVCAMAGLVAASPVWLFHTWRFIAPGLNRRERRRVWAFLAAAVPLFLGGLVIAYRVMPQALGLLIGFTPAGVSNIIPVATYIAFICRMLLVFGCAFLLPVFIVGLNAAGVVTARTMAGWWRQLLIGVLVFAAVATPTGDPINMLVLAVPMLTVSFLAIGVCAIADRRRRSHQPQWADDETSPLSDS